MSEKGITLAESRKAYLQQYMTIRARMKHREQTIQELKQHLRNGTFPKRMKSLKPYPTMETPEAQTKVDEACQRAEQVILDEKVQEYDRKLEGDRASLQALKESRRKQRQQKLAEKVAQTSKPSKKVTITQLQQELRDLQAKYSELSQNLPLVKPKAKEI